MGREETDAAQQNCASCHFRPLRSLSGHEETFADRIINRDLCKKATTIEVATPCHSPFFPILRTSKCCDGKTLEPVLAISDDEERWRSPQRSLQLKNVERQQCGADRVFEIVTSGPRKGAQASYLRPSGRARQPRPSPKEHQKNSRSGGATARRGPGAMPLSDKRRGVLAVRRYLAGGLSRGCR
jgi:hypothetical protein